MSLPPDPNPIATIGVPPKHARAGVVLVHGRGATAASMLPFHEALGADDVAYMAPQAPGGSWYPYSFLAPIAMNEPNLSAALERIDACIATFLAAGLTRDRLMLLGFSQGACLSLEYQARASAPVAAVVALSGGLIGSGDMGDGHPPREKQFDYPNSLAATFAFLGCSDTDAHIPLERVELSADILGRLGAQVDARIYPRMGHTVNENELEAARDLLHKLGR